MNLHNTNSEIDQTYQDLPSLIENWDQYWRSQKNQYPRNLGQFGRFLAVGHAIVAREPTELYLFDKCLMLIEETSRGGFFGTRPSPSKKIFKHIPMIHARIEENNDARKLDLLFYTTEKMCIEFEDPATRSNWLKYFDLCIDVSIIRRRSTTSSVRSNPNVRSRSIFGKRKPSIRNEVQPLTRRNSVGSSSISSSGTSSDRSSVLSNPGPLPIPIPIPQPHRIPIMPHNSSSPRNSLVVAKPFDPFPDVEPTRIINTTISSPTASITPASSVSAATAPIEDETIEKGIYKQRLNEREQVHDSHNKGDISVQSQKIKSPRPSLEPLPESPHSTTAQELRKEYELHIQMLDQLEDTRASLDASDEVGWYLVEERHAELEARIASLKKAVEKTAAGDLAEYEAETFLLDT